MFSHWRRVLPLAFAKAMSAGRARKRRLISTGPTRKRAKRLCLRLERGGKPGKQQPPSVEYPRIHGYEILGELGKGGMGVVYKARQIKADRLVALKMILHGDHADDAGPRPLPHRGRGHRPLAASHIVQIYEIGEHDGLPFFSLEFCPGGSLDKKLKGTPLPPQEAADLVETLARAMHAAHKRGVVHRDLKPANILLAGRAGSAQRRTRLSLRR